MTASRPGTTAVAVLAVTTGAPFNRNSLISLSRGRRDSGRWPARVAGVTAAAVAAALPGALTSPAGPAAGAPAAKPACPADRPGEAAALATARICGGEVKIAGLTNEYDEGWAQPNGQVHWKHHSRPVRVEQNI